MVLDDEEMIAESNQARLSLQTFRAHGWPEDWTYPKRRDMQEVAQGLFLGPYSVAQRSNLNYLKLHGITHIICVRQDIEAQFIKPNFPDKFQYLTLNIADNHKENIKQHFDAVTRFIEEGLSRGGRVLIHGNGGLSRSATLAIAYVMLKNDLRVEEAVAMVQKKRFCICPNVGFLEQLKDFEMQQSLQRQSDDTGDYNPRKKLRTSFNM